MTQRLNLRRIVALVSAVMMLAYASAGMVTAQEEPGGSGLQITPTRIELTVQPGELKEFSVQVKNVTQGTITVAAFLNDFNADEDGTGQPKLIVDQNAERTPTSLDPFLKGLTDFELKAGETKEVKYQIDAPANSGAGAFFGALRFVALPKGADRESAERQVALNASVASLVLVEVEGDIIESVEVQAVEARRDNEHSSFFINKPNKVAIVIKNKGNSFSKPFGTIQILGMNGSEVHSYELNSTDPRGNILPQSTRVFIDDLQGIGTPGRYAIMANVTHGAGGEIITEKVHFWYIPIWLIALIAAILIAIGVFLYYRYRGGTGLRRRSIRK